MNAHKFEVCGWNCRQNEQMTSAVGAAAIVMMAGATAAAEPRFAVALAFEEQASNTVLDAMRGEVRRIFNPSHVNVDVLVLKGTLEVRNVDRIIHMDVKGTCASMPRHGKIRPSTLAHMFAVNRELQPIGSLDCRAISDYLGTVTPAVFGRAFGRVLAHEIYHYITQRRDHSGRGLFASSLSDISLTSSELSFIDRDLDALKEALQRIDEDSPTESNAGF